MHAGEHPRGLFLVSSGGRGGGRGCGSDCVDHAVEIGLGDGGQRGNEGDGSRVDESNREVGGEGAGGVPGAVVVVEEAAACPRKVPVTLLDWLFLRGVDAFCSVQGARYEHDGWPSRWMAQGR